MLIWRKRGKENQNGGLPSFQFLLFERVSNEVYHGKCSCLFLGTDRFLAAFLEATLFIVWTDAHKFYLFLSKLVLTTTYFNKLDDAHL